MIDQAGWMLMNSGSTLTKGATVHESPQARHAAP